jgi:parvulin-like peptidyl-prolyl isomerase
MFKMLRSKAKIFYWVIAVSFILFGVVFSYGSSYTGCNNDGPGANNEYGLVGEINGSPLTAAQYENMYTQILAYTKGQNQNREMNANQYASARQQAWDQILRQVLVTQAIESYDIQVSDAELKNRFEQNPPPALLNNFRDPQTGVVNMEMYYAELQNPDNDWSGPEAYVRQVIQTEKLQTILSSDVAISDDDVRKEYLTQTGSAVAEYLGVLYSGLESDFTPTEDAIKSYYEGNLDQYKRLEKVECKVVRFAKEPGEEDWSSALQEITEIREEIDSGNLTFADAATRYSEDGSSTNGGALGTFDRNRMVAEFTEAAFSLPVEEVSQPVKTKFGYHLILVTAHHNDSETNELFQVDASHILLKVVPGNATLAMINDSAKEFASRVDGGTFVSTAEAEAMDLMSPAAFIKGRDIPGLPISMGGSLWAHRAATGDVSGVFENRDYFYVVLAGGKTPAGPAALEDVKSQVILALKKENNKKLAMAKLSPAVGEIQMGRTMAEVAEGAELKYAVTDTFTYNANVQDVGFGTDFNKEAIEGEVGRLVTEVETLRGLFALTPLWISPFDQANFDSRKAGIQAALLGRAQNEKVEEFFKKALEEAEIKDFR